MLRANCVASTSKSVWRGLSTSSPRLYAEVNNPAGETKRDEQASPTTPSEELTPASAAEQDPTPTLPVQDDPAPSSKQQGRGYRAWLMSEGAQFRHPIQGRTNWIGKTPFPMNPTFNPRAPLAETIKVKIYNAYLYNSSNAQQGVSDSVIVRAISTKFGVAMDRVRAIIRLKELEHSFKQQGKPLQTELKNGMERYLGVKEPGSEHWKGTDAPEPEPPMLGSKKTVFEMLDTETDEQSVFLPLVEKAKNAQPTVSAQKVRSDLRHSSQREVDQILFREVDNTPMGEKWKKMYEKSRGRSASSP